MIRRLVVRTLLGFVATQITVILALVGIDARRKRHRAQGHFPHSRTPPVTIGDSQIQLYTYGDDLYADMLDAIRGAREQVLLETFIWKDDACGQRFKVELECASARGVSVYIIFDAFANLVVPRAFKQFSSTLHVLEYSLVPRFWHLIRLRGYARDHRKILVVDGQTAFVGGYNIGASYATEWRDTHARVEGPSAWELENVFIDFWNAHRGDRLPALPNRGTRIWEPRISVHRNDPQMVIFPIRSTYLEAIDRATHLIYLTHAYFIPDRVVLQGLLEAAARGVDVRVVLPATSNHVVADWLARGYYDLCLRGGIRLLLYQHAMVHAKTATIDSVWSTVGTANLDRLSMVGNFEVNVEFYDRALALQMEQVFDADAHNAQELTLERWRTRPVLWKMAEAILLPLRPLL